MSLVQIPNWFAGEALGSTKDNPFPLPDAYLAVQQSSVCFMLFIENCSVCFFFHITTASDTPTAIFVLTSLRTWKKQDNP